MKKILRRVVQKMIRMFILALKAFKKQNIGEFKGFCTINYRKVYK